MYDFQWGGTKGTDVEFVFGAAHANEIAYVNFEANFDIWAKSKSITEDNKAARLALAKANIHVDTRKKLANRRKLN